MAKKLHILDYTTTTSQCFHCGEIENTKNGVVSDEKWFCCNGCCAVYELLKKSDTLEYYQGVAENFKANKPQYKSGKFNFLDNPELAKAFVQFEDREIMAVALQLPSIHCSSCLFLLENLPKLNPGIANCTVNFIQKTASIVFNKNTTTFKSIAELLSKIGYEPNFSISNRAGKKGNAIDNKLILQLGIAGFAFANIMIFSIARYVMGNEVQLYPIAKYFDLFSLILSFPVLFFSASGFFTSAWNGIKLKKINIDLLVAIALLSTFGRSIYEYFSHISGGYFDSLSGIVFFMLIGKWVQHRINYKLFTSKSLEGLFPLSVKQKINGIIVYKKYEDIENKDILVFEEDEILVSNGTVLEGEALIDYSFITGENKPQLVVRGDKVFAGGRIKSAEVTVVITEKKSQEQLLQLLYTPKKAEEKIKQPFYDIWAAWFTIGVLALSVSGFAYWMYVGNSGNAWSVLTTVLIVACPCSLLLAHSYTFGTVVHQLSKRGLHLKSTHSIEKIALINTIVFDKTGTLTELENTVALYKGRELNKREQQVIHSLLQKSKHPLAKFALSQFNSTIGEEVSYFTQYQGLGIESLGDIKIKIGSEKFTGCAPQCEAKSSVFLISINNSYAGEIHFSHPFRQNLDATIQELNQNYHLSVISGDNANQEKELQQLFPNSHLHFGATPQDKVEYIEKLRTTTNDQILFVGDGINDSQVLQKADCSIAVQNSHFQYIPDADGIIQGSKLIQLATFIDIAKGAKKLVLLIFLYSFFYNLIGLFFALQGALTPLLSAIIMPISSLTVIFFSIQGAKNMITFNLKKQKQH